MLGNERAAAALQAFAQSQVGDDDPRMMAAIALVDLGIFSEDEPVRLWLQGEWREVLLRRQLITEEWELEYTDEVIDLLDEAITAFQEGKEKKAEELYKKMIALEPAAKEAYGNLGAMFLKQGRDEEAERLLQKAIEIDPNYVHPRCNLASTRITQGRLEEAEELLKPIAELKTFHPQELLFYNRISAELFIAQEDYESAEKYLEMILELEPEDEVAQTRLWTVRMLKDSGGWLARWREQTRQRREKRRRRSLKGTDLQSCLSRHLKDNLLAMARALDIKPPTGIRKAELIALLAESLADPEVVGRAWRGLTDEEREALTTVLAQGGTVPYKEVSQEYGDDLEGPYYWHYREPETTIGRLRLHGLLFEGEREGEVVLVIPTEVRGLLADLAR
jgi:tetratricopeptide (TPR) repeat protein